MEKIMVCPPAKEYEELVINIPPYLPPIEWPDCCIYRVPKQLRNVNPAAYTPKLVSIGPFHHRLQELEGMEMHKLRYFKDFLERTKKRQENLLRIIKVNEEKIRHCYSEDCTCEDFVKMILLDAIFIIELLLKEEDGRKGKKSLPITTVIDPKKEKDYILSKPWLRNGILHDLLLLENQLPFFVLEKLYMFAFNIDSSSYNHREEGKQIEEHKKDLMKQDSPFVKLSRRYFENYNKHPESIAKEGTEEPLLPIGKEVKHFTDLLRYLFCPPNMMSWNIEAGSPDTRFCATKLDDAGLKFRAVKDHNRLLDITLPGCLEYCFPCLGNCPVLDCILRCLICCACWPCFILGYCGCPMHVLEFPQLVIDYDMEAIFRNLMALEQCHYPSDAFICHYVLLLDRLIDTEKDVDLLVDKEVIANRLGSNAAVAKLINQLGNQIVTTTSSYKQIGITQQLTRHYEYPLNHFLATLKREYFPNVFRGTTTVVGLIVLGFTLWSFLRPLV